MNFEEARKCLLKGKICAYNCAQFKIQDGWLMNSRDGGKTWKKSNLATPHLEEDIWEVVEDKKTLSDKIESYIDGEVKHIDYCKVCDVSEAIKEFLDIVITEVNGKDGAFILTKAEEIFGERLVK